MRADFLATNFDEGAQRYREFSGFDVVFVTGDPYYDHPLSGVAVLARLLESKGWRVGIVAQPQGPDEFEACSQPKYFFCVTSGLLDSMLANYTPMLRKREGVLVPERGLQVYTQRLKHQFPGCMTVLGGVEATIRRFTHFDYKENALRRGILNDTKADLLLFGNAERSLLTLLERMKAAVGKKREGKRPRSLFENVREDLDLASIDGAAFRLKKDESVEGCRELPSFEQCQADPDQFNLLTAVAYVRPDDAFVEACGQGRIRHNRPSHPLTDEEMDVVYAQPFTRELHPETKQFAFNQDMVGFLASSVVIGRGCWGGCSFCVIPLVQGKRMAKRSKESILKEIAAIYAGGERHIADLTLPTLNMYGSFCELYRDPQTIHSPILGKAITVHNKSVGCDQECVGCPHRKLSDELIPILEGVEELQRQHPGAGLELRSALRHDIILRQKALFRKVMAFTQRLKIAPEHVSATVLAQMRKASPEAFDEFLKEFAQVNKEQGTQKRLVPYFVAAHPGCTMQDMEALKQYCGDRDLFVNLTQIFTPTPGTLSTAMYYTGKNPLSREELYVPRSFREKKDQKNVLLARDDEDLRDENS